MSRRAPFRFELYVTGDTPNSALALANLSALCRARLPGRHQIEVIDLFEDPRRALADGILMTPTLVKLAPLPVRKIIGTLSRTQSLAAALGLDTPGA